MILQRRGPPNCAVVSSFLTSAVFSTLLKKLERKFKMKLAFVPFIVPHYKNVHRYTTRGKYISKINIIGITWGNKFITEDKRQHRDCSGQGVRLYLDR